MANTVQTTKVEATTKTLKIRLSGLHQPATLNGNPNADKVTFLTVTDAMSGQPLTKQLTTTPERAHLFGFSCFCISENATDDGRGGLIEELNTLNNKPRYFEIVVRDVPQVKEGESVGYYTKNGEWREYRNGNCYIIENVVNELESEKFSIATNGALKIQAFEVLTGEKFDYKNPEHRAFFATL